MFRAILILLATHFFFPLSAEEELIVHIGAQNQLTPLYIAPLSSEGSGFDKSYISALEKVLRFDFENNGKTAVSTQSKGVSKIETSITQKIAHVKLTLHPQGKVKGLEGIVLTGQIAHDRQLIHHIHDTVFQALFGTSGIASTHILYTLRTRAGDQASEWISEVWQADYDGANAKQITHDRSLCVTPVFIPSPTSKHSRHFLYVSYKVGQPKIYLASLDDPLSKRLTLLRGNQLMPTISPTLDKMAFISDITGNPDLFVQDFSLDKGLIGKPRQVFSAPGGAQGTPSFSPDGKRLVFVSNKDGTPRIYLFTIPPEGASIAHIKPQIISKKAKENTSPAWSPDGKKIAYSALTSGTRQIWIYDVVTGVETQLTEGGNHKENPTWAPNSLHVMFNSTSPTSSELYMMNLNQKKAVKITQGPGEKRFPAWEVIGHAS